jgi:hypothetical protein
MQTTLQRHEAPFSSRVNLGLDEWAGPARNLRNGWLVRLLYQVSHFHGELKQSILWNTCDRAETNNGAKTVEMLKGKQATHGSELQVVCKHGWRAGSLRYDRMTLLIHRTCRSFTRCMLG